MRDAADADSRATAAREVRQPRLRCQPRPATLSRLKRLSHLIAEVKRFSRVSPIGIRTDFSTSFWGVKTLTRSLSRLRLLGVF